MTELLARKITLHKAGRDLVDGASLCLRPYELTVLLGPNGAGKTSLLRSILRLENSNGEITLDGRDISRMSPMERARSIAYLPQNRALAWPNRVRDIVALGRFAHGSSMGRLATLDREAVEQALQSCGISELAERSADTLSGGELSRVHFARAFASQAPFLIADEPVAALDPLHQFRIMELILRYVANGGSALVVLHDISLAARFADRLVWMKDGQTIATGSVEETLTVERLAEVYGVTACISGRQVEITGPVGSGEFV